jgi:hypothetical protein
MNLKTRGNSCAVRLLPIMLLGLCSCREVSYDMRDLKQPVVLNSNPFVFKDPGTNADLVDLDEYEANVMLTDLAVANSQNSTDQQESAANPAQVNAFLKIGGQTNRFIRNITLDVDYTAVNGLVALDENISIQAAGTVTEVRWQTASNTAAAGGGTKP